MIRTETCFYFFTGKVGYTHRLLPTCNCFGIPFLRLLLLYPSRLTALFIPCDVYTKLCLFCESTRAWFQLIFPHVHGWEEVLKYIKCENNGLLEDFPSKKKTKSHDSNHLYIFLTQGCQSSPNAYDASLLKFYTKIPPFYDKPFSLFYSNIFYLIELSNSKL